MDPKRIEYIHWQDTTDHTKKKQFLLKKNQKTKQSVRSETNTAV